jgi:hypothetical protein
MMRAREEWKAMLKEKISWPFMNRIVRRVSSIRVSATARGIGTCLVLILSLGFAAPAKAQSFYVVDCSGANPAYYPSISAALQVAIMTANSTNIPNTYILLANPCTENVSINNATNLALEPLVWGTTVSITGNVTVNSSTGVFLYGLNVTNPNGDAFDIQSSHGTILYSCTANGNHGTGLSTSSMSDVTIEGPVSFDNNGNDGILTSDNSYVDVQTWGGPVDISSNQGVGVYVGIGSIFETLGNTTIENNTNATGALTPTGYGIQAVAAGRVQLGTCYGPNQVSGNQNGGFDVEENAELSIWSCGTTSVTTVSGNGPVGISAGFGTQVTLYSNAQITGHSESGVELYGNSQLHVFGTNLISQNGSASNPRSAGIVVDGNSEAYLRGGQLLHNEGPGILALVNSSVDFTGATFTGNTGGIINCDSSAYMVSDLEHVGQWHGGGINCTTPHNFGNRHGFAASPRIPDLTSARARTAMFMAQTRARHK